jgi:hypothetical protein
VAPDSKFHHLFYHSTKQAQELPPKLKFRGSKGRGKHSCCEVGDRDLRSSSKAMRHRMKERHLGGELPDNLAVLEEPAVHSGFQAPFAALQTGPLACAELHMSLECSSVCDAPTACLASASKVRKARS